MFRSWERPATEPLPPVSEAAGHWVVSSHELVRQVLADPDTFRPDNALHAVTPIPIQVLRILSERGFRLPPTLANNHAPSHPALRAAVGEALHPARVATQRGFVTGLVRRRIAAMATLLREGGAVDLHGQLGYDVPLLVLGRLIALPDDDIATVKSFTQGALELFWAPVSAQRQAELAELVGDYHARLRRFVRSAPGLIAQLRQVTAELGMGEDEVVAALFFLLVAGQETTSQFLTLLLHRLMAEPAVLEGLVTGRLDPATVVEEGLRLEPPIVTWRRMAARDVTLDGVTIPCGGSVLLWLARAGRDPAVVASPETFHPGQPGSRRHLAFGAGAHRCLGIHLARMEATIVVAEAAPLLRQARVVRPPHCPDNLSFRLPDALIIQHF